MTDSDLIDVTNKIRQTLESKIPKDNVIDSILKVSEIAKSRSINDVFGQVVEEIGEISTAIYRPYKVYESAFDECVDLIVAVTDLAYLLVIKENPSLTRNEINHLISKVQEKKCNKWVNSVRGTK